MGIASFLVGIIINGTASNFNDDLIDIASEAIIIVDGNSLNITGIDGNISGVELTLNHDNNFYANAGGMVHTVASASTGIQFYFGDASSQLVSAGTVTLYKITGA